MGLADDAELVIAARREAERVAHDAELRAKEERSRHDHAAQAAAALLVSEFLGLASAIARPLPIQYSAIVGGTTRGSSAKYYDVATSWHGYFAPTHASGNTGLLVLSDGRVTPGHLVLAAKPYLQYATVRRSTRLRLGPTPEISPPYFWTNPTYDLVGGISVETLRGALTQGLASLRK